MAGRRNNNEGSYTKLPDGRWMGRVSMPDGKRRVCRGDTRAEVQTKMKALLAEAEQQRGMMPGNDFTTLRQFFEVWLTGKDQSRPGRTAETYRYRIQHYAAELLDISPNKLTAAHVQQLYTKRFKEGLSGTTVWLLHRVLHTALEAAVRQGVMIRNPTDQIDAPRKEHHEQQTWTMQETRRFFDAIKGDRYEALFILAISTGMREGEIFGLRWPTVDLERGWIQVRGNLQRINRKLTVKQTKTQASTHMIYVTPLAIDALSRHWQIQQEEREAMGDRWNNQHDLVFCSTIGTPVQYRNIIRRHYLPAIERAGIPVIPFHDMRHTAATLLLGAGIHPKLVSEMLGHSSVKTTMDLYSHATPAMHQTATMVMQQILSGEMLPLANGNGTLALAAPNEELMALRAWRDKTLTLVQAFANGVDVDNLFCRRCLCMLPDHDDTCTTEKGNEA